MLLLIAGLLDAGSYALVVVPTRNILRSSRAESITSNGDAIPGEFYGKRQWTRRLVCLSPAYRVDCP